MIMPSGIGYVYSAGVVISVMMIARTMEYDDVLKAVDGKTAAILACGTCARLCNGMGGTEAADRLADRLRRDGIDITASVSTSAACIMAKVNAAEIPDGTEVVIALTCDTGAVCAYDALGTDVVTPFVTIGLGYIDSNGRPIVICGYGKDRKTLDEAARKKGMTASPLL